MASICRRMAAPAFSGTGDCCQRSWTPQWSSVRRARALAKQRRCERAAIGGNQPIGATLFCAIQGAAQEWYNYTLRRFNETTPLWQSERMQHFFRWIGYAMIAIWIVTFLTSLTMMWHREWMESDPLSELITGGVHLAAVVTGAGLGVLLFVPGVRHILSPVQMGSYVIGFALALVSARLYF